MPTEGVQEEVQIDKPWTWVKFSTGLCEGCWAGCCHSMPVEVSIPDLIRLGLVTETEAATSPRQVAARLRKGGWVKTFRAKQLVFVLEQRADGDCVFLDERTRRCSVYEKRPEICRQFPKIGPKPGHCPHRTSSPK
ncbi:MAG: YkgJ family cysteine cluster protein [Deltaproteobacteria bacterium]|nr:YkgJ family cysteine cluster protein [Deltaproteobacteria bacterium]